MRQVNQIIVFFHLKHHILLLSFSQASFTPSRAPSEADFIDNTQT